MSFNLPKFLRRLPAEDLRTYFSERGYEQATEIDWDEKQPELAQQIRTAIEGLAEHDRYRVFDDFERVCQLADDLGQLALRGTLGDAPELLDTIPAMDSHEGRALLALLRRPDAFEHALS